MAEIKWIKLDTDIFSNRKILQIESLPDGDAIIVIWIKLLALAGNINDNGMVYFTQEIPYTDQMLSSQFRRPLATIQMAMKVFEEFGMIEIVDDILHISNWEKYQNTEQMAVIREQNRVRQKRWYDSHKAISEKPNVRPNVSITLPNATDIDIDIEEDKIRKDIDIEKDIEKEKPVRKRTSPLSSRVFFPNDELLEAKFHEFIDHRKKLKKPLDEYKAEGIIKELEKLSGGDNDVAIQILQKSIDKRWQGIFALKEEKQPATESWLDTWRNA